MKQRFDIVYLHNPSDEEITNTWDGQPYVIGPKEVKPMTDFVAGVFISHDQSREDKDKKGLEILNLSEVELKVKVNGGVVKTPKTPKKKEVKEETKETKEFADLEK